MGRARHRLRKAPSSPGASSPAPGTTPVRPGFGKEGSRGSVETANAAPGSFSLEVGSSVVDESCRHEKRPTLSGACDRWAARATSRVNAADALLDAIRDYVALRNGIWARPLALTNDAATRADVTGANLTARFQTTSALLRRQEGEGIGRGFQQLAGVRQLRHDADSTRFRRVHGRRFRPVGPHCLRRRRRSATETLTRIRLAGTAYPFAVKGWAGRSYETFSIDVQ